MNFKIHSWFEEQFYNKTEKRLEFIQTMVYHYNAEKHKENRKPHEDKAIMWTGRIDQVKIKNNDEKTPFGLTRDESESDIVEFIKIKGVQ